MDQMKKEGTEAGELSKTLARINPEIETKTDDQKKSETTKPIDEKPLATLATDLKNNNEKNNRSELSKTLARTQLQLIRDEKLNKNSVTIAIEEEKDVAKKPTALKRKKRGYTPLYCSLESLDGEDPLPEDHDEERIDGDNQPEDDGKCCAIIFCSVVGFIVLITLLDYFFSTPFDPKNYVALNTILVDQSYFDKKVSNSEYTEK